VIAVSYTQPPPGHASFHGRTTTSAIEASMLQARACGTVYRCTCDETWTSRVSSVNWKHFYLGVSRPRHIVTVLLFCALEILLLTYLLTYLHAVRLGFFFFTKRAISIHCYCYY